MEERGEREGARLTLGLFDLWGRMRDREQKEREGGREGEGRVWTI